MEDLTLITQYQHNYIIFLQDKNKYIPINS